MRLIILPILTFLIISVGLSHGQAVVLGHAITETAPPAIQPQIVLTQFSANGDFIELYNQSAEPIKASSVVISVGFRSQQSNEVRETRVVLPGGWILSKQYLLLHSSVIDSNIEMLKYDKNFDKEQVVFIEVSARGYSYSIQPTSDVGQAIWYQHKQRGNATLKTSVLNALPDYTAKSGTPASTADMIYHPTVSSVGLRIIEILANSNNCAPNDITVECNDYIKLQNTSDKDIDLQLYRLRTDSGGSKSSSSNSFQLYGILMAGETAVITLKDNGDPLSVTNTGGYVWVEDIEGVQLYEDTLVQYPDASTSASKGMSWAWNSEINEWQWMVPAPHGYNYWPTQISLSGDNMSDCAIGKERNPETNRCRNIPVVSVMADCKPGQERNPATGRCRNVLTSSALKACSAGQTRNLETGRCRKVQSAKLPVACKENQERNPATGRCKKKVLGASDIASVQDLASGRVSSKKVFVYAGVVLLAAIGYGIYEWRQEIVRRFASLKSVVKR